MKGVITQSVVDKIVNDMPKKLNQLEIARYLYISLGKVIGYDINILEEKNDFFNLADINNSNKYYLTI